MQKCCCSFTQRQNKFANSGSLQPVGISEKIPGNEDLQIIIATNKLICIEWGSRPFWLTIFNHQEWSSVVAHPSSPECLLLRTSAFWISVSHWVILISVAKEFTQACTISKSSGLKEPHGRVSTLQDYCSYLRYHSTKKEGLPCLQLTVPESGSANAAEHWKQSF